MRLAEHLIPVHELLRRAFPDGVPREDYLPLLVVLREGLSERNLAAVVAELMDDEITVVDNDAAAATSVRRPPATDVQRVRDKLAEAGWEPEELP